MKTPIFIYGAGGLGREILSFLKGSEQWEPAGFIDDGISPRTSVKGILILGGIGILRDLPQPANVILAIGDPLVKQKLGTQLKEISGLHFPAIVHPQAILQDKEDIQIGAGAIITAGCILTTAIQLGTHTLINLNCTVG